MNKVKFDNNSDAILVFSDSSYFLGNGVGKKNNKAVGEICFNTAMTGYQEIITDPSYCGQIITFTFPHVGNVGCNDNDYESKSIYSNGIIIRNPITNPSNFRQQYHLNDWLEKNDFTGICDVDTRAITSYIRENGVQNVVIYYGSENEEVNIDELANFASSTPDLEGCELAKKVTANKKYSFSGSTFDLESNSYKSRDSFDYKIAVIDYGVKTNILRDLVNVGLDPTVLPADSSFDEIMAVNPDGIFLSNGPGDPFATSKYAVPVIKELVNSNIPIFGICMGHQLLSIASGLSTVKMHQGHRGANHPVKNLENSIVEITSQNHGFCVSKEGLNLDEIEITHVSLFDDTIEGIRFKNHPVFSVQYHPESSPGPNDSKYLFSKFKDLIIASKS